jgi:four helix bundle protein
MNDEAPEDLRARTKRFGLQAVALFTKVPTTPQGQVMSRQMLRSATSVGAHYREACRARSDAEFISKMEGGLQELDETGYWLELLTESGTCTIPAAHELRAEADELIRIFVAIVRKRKGN